MGAFNSAHIFGTLVPVEEPSTAFKISDVADLWIFTYSTATILCYLGVIEGGAQNEDETKEGIP